MSSRADAARKTREAHLAEALCHCREDTTGHPLNSPTCEVTVKVGTYPSRSRCTPGQGTTPEDIYAELAKVDPKRRAQWRRAAKIAKAATAEYSAQVARSSDRAREIRTRSLSRPAA